MSMDQGTIGWPAQFWMFQNASMRGCMWPDFGHKCWNNGRNDLNMVGFRMLITIATVCFNLPLGPFHRDCFFFQIQKAATEYFKAASYKDALYLQFYEGICEDMGCNTAASCGSQAHIIEVWRSLPRAEYFKREGKNVKLRQWYSWFKKLQLRRGRIGTPCPWCCITWASARSGGLPFQMLTLQFLVWG